MPSAYDALLDSSRYDTLLADKPKADSPYDVLLDAPTDAAPPVSNERRADINQFLRDTPYPQENKSWWEVANTSPEWVNNAVDAITPSGDVASKLDVTGLAGISSSIFGKEKTDQFTEGVAQEVGKLAKSLVTPFGVATLGLGAAPRAVQKAAGFLFALHLAHQAPETLSAVVNAKTPEEFGHAIGSAGLQIGMGTAIGAHLMGREVAPLTAKALDATQPPHEHSTTVSDSSGSSENRAAQRQAESGGSGDLPAGAGLPAEERNAAQHHQAGVGGEQNATPADLAPLTTEVIKSPGKVTQLLTKRQNSSDPVERQRFLDEARKAQDELDKAEQTNQRASTELAPPDLPQGPGKMTVGELPPQETTGLKRAVVDTERLARGAEPIPTPERQREEAVVQAAEDKVDADSTVAPSLVARIVDDGAKAITEQDAAVLLVERNRLMNERRAWEAKLGSGEDAEIARTKLDDIEQQLNRLDHAQRAAGTTWGRLGHMYQRMIQEDYTLEAMESKERAVKGRPLTEDERATIAQQAAKIAELQKVADSAEQARSEAVAAQRTTRVLEATIADLNKQPKFGKEVFDIAHGIVNRWKTEADASRKAFRQAMGMANVGFDPTLIVHVAKILRAKIGEFGLDKAEAFTQTLAELGAEAKPYLNKAWEKAQALIGKEKAGPKVKEAVKAGVKKPGEKTPVDIRAKAKAEAVAGEPLSHQTVYELVRAHINEGVHGEDTLMKAVHKDVQEAYPDASERDVRRAFSEYGEVKFPSKEADKVELRELRTLVRLQESIDRETAGLDSLHTGLQRDKATQAIREKQKTLNELLKKRTGPPSPEKLASRDEARKTALKNQIEDLDKQLRTGEKPAKGAPLADSPEVEYLKAQRDAMKVKLAEIEAAENPPPTPDEKYNQTRLKVVKKQIEDLQRRIKAGDYAPKPKPIPKTKDAAVTSAEFALAKEKETFNRGLFDQQMKDRSGPRKAFDFARDVVNLARAAQTSFDLSAVLRQGGFITMAHPVRALKAFPAMLRAMASEKGQFAVNHEIASRPNAPLYKSSKLYLHDPENPSLAKMEEAYMSRWAYKIPGIAHSERAYVTFLNRLRADSFDAMSRALDHPPTPEEAKALSNFINVATGRGNLGSASKAAVNLNTAFFSPRYVVSRFELLAGQPLYKGTGATRIAIAGEYARFLAGIGVFYALAKSSGASVETDPRSPDFGKLKFGNTRIDPLSGLSQTAVLLSRMTLGETKKNGVIVPIRGEKLKYGQDDAAAYALRFLRTKFSPLVGTTLDVASGRNVIGQPVTSGSAAQRMVMPLSFGDIRDAMVEQGVPRGTALALLAMFGMGVQNYNDQKPK